MRGFVKEALLPIPPSPPPAPVPSVPLRDGARALNAAAVVMLALYFGQALLVPMVLAVLLAFVLAPLVRLLQRGHVPATLAVLLTVAAAFGIIGGIGVVLGNQATKLADALPQFQATIDEKIHSLSIGGEFVERTAASLRRLMGGGAADGTVPAGPAFETPSTLVVVRTVLAPLLGPVATAGVVIVFSIFVLRFREDLRDRLVRLSGRQDLHRTILAMNEAARRLSRFFVMQLGLAVAFGSYVTGALWLAGLPAPFLWGLLAGTMRFVPFIGSAIAVGPPVLLAWAVSPGWELGLAVLAVMLGGELVMGQIVEPLIYGHRTGLSPIAVILSATFWAFLWGPVGLLLATPLSVCLVVVGRHVPALSFVHVLLSDASPLDPEETFYQRALEGNRTELTRQAVADLAGSGMAEYFDGVALRGLVLAQADLTRHAIDFERLEAVHAEVAAMLAALPLPPVADATNLPAAWRAAGAVLVIPGRGPLDDLAATMASQSLSAKGFGAAVLPNAVLGSRAAALPGAADVRLCCLSVLDNGSSASSIHLFLRRMRRALPEAHLVVGLWQATADSPVLAALRVDGGAEVIVLSLGEMLALAAAFANRGAAAYSAASPSAAAGAAPGAAAGAVPLASAYSRSSTSSNISSERPVTR